MKTIRHNFSLVLFALVMFYQSQLYGQAPQQFNYQGVARQTDGQPLANKKIGLRISILNLTLDGAALYSEAREVITNPFGLYTMQIGSEGALNKTGSITGINWGDGSKYIKVEISPDADQRYQIAGTNQLLSVPYALYAGNVKDAPTLKAAWNENKNHLPATSNDQDIYQLGKIGVMTKDPLANLDVRGAVRFGLPLTNEVIGARSAAFGQENKATGNNSTAFGQQTTATGENTTSFGLRTHASGRMATAFGSDNMASGSRSTVFGTLSEASGDYSTSIGSNNKAAGFLTNVIGGGLRAEEEFQVIVGTNNVPVPQSAFQIGNGYPRNASGDYRNAMTVMKDGSTLIGNSTVAPNSTLQVLGSFSLPIRTINSGQPTITDHTLLVRGSFALPNAGNESIGRIYVLVLDNSSSYEVSGKIRQQGNPITGLSLKDAPGNRGYTIQSDGKDWVVIGQF